MEKSQHSPPGQFCTNFDSAVPDAGGVARADSCALYGRDHAARGAIAHGPASLVICSGVERGGVCPAGDRLWVSEVVGAIREVVRVSVKDVAHPDGIRRQGGGDIQIAVRDVGIVRR